MEKPDDAWDRYFAFPHLFNERLRDTSAPFCALAEDILSERDPNFPKLMCWITENVPECRQRTRCLEKLERSEEALHGVHDLAGDHALDLLLEAKDCAVRAVLSST